MLTLLRTSYRKLVSGNFFGSSRGATVFGDDGFMVFEGLATNYQDLVFPLVQKSTGPGNPNFTAFNGNLVKPQFAVNDALQLECSEAIHAWLEGTTMEVHVHVTSMTNVAAARGLKFEVELSYVPTADGTTQWIEPVTLTAELTVPPNTPALTEYALSMGTFTMEGGRIGGQICMRVKRIASAGTAPATDPFLTQVGVHIECDGVGSNDRYTKITAVQL